VVTGVTPLAIWQVLDQLQRRKRLVESGSITDDQQRQKLEYLLRTKKWNPYCFRHSSITYDADLLPDYALKKKVRWSMDSKQGKRYIKHKMGDDAKNKILERYGIKIADKQPQPVSMTCPRCKYVNRSGSKYCERSGCNYPLTQQAFDEIKAAEQAKVQEIRELKERMDKMGDIIIRLDSPSVLPLCLKLLLPCPF
jgi:integrase/recombinase XerD